MSPEKNTSKHTNPDPRPDNHSRECRKAKSEESGVGGEDAACKLEDTNGFVEGVTTLEDGNRPEDS
jgi:hypothetical protein